jgi:hypothetical protein
MCCVAFNGTNSSGVRCPWRFGNLNNGGNGGLAYENGNNSPSNANWNGRPRLSYVLYFMQNITYKGIIFILKLHYKIHAIC